MILKPYFLENPEWYTEDEDGEYRLTDKAPPKAVESFREFKEAEKWMEEHMIMFVEPKGKQIKEMLKQPNSSK
jgi:hypothetical protein